MTVLFCYRPHVQGSTAVTTPDLLLEQIQVGKWKLGCERLLSTATIASNPDLTLASAVALISADYGPIIAPAFLIKQAGTPVSIVIGRKACRRDDIAGHGDSVNLDGKILPQNILSDVPARGSVLVEQCSENVIALSGLYETEFIDGKRRYQLALKV